MATEQYGLNQRGPMTFKAGIAAMKPFRLVNLTEATGVVNYAFEEDDVFGITLNTGKLVGDPMTVLALPAFNQLFEVAVLDTGSRGASLYLDVQATQGAATGLMKFTAGAATLVWAIANQAISVADATNGQFISAYQPVVPAAVAAYVTAAIAALP